jgi:hypothetical protein
MSHSSLAADTLGRFASLCRLCVCARLSFLCFITLPRSLPSGGAVEVAPLRQSSFEALAKLEIGWQSRPLPPISFGVGRTELLPPLTNADVQAVIRAQQGAYGVLKRHTGIISTPVHPCGPMLKGRDQSLRSWLVSHRLRSLRKKDVAAAMHEHA